MPETLFAQSFRVREKTIFREKFKKYFRRERETHVKRFRNAVKRFRNAVKRFRNAVKRF